MSARTPKSILGTAVEVAGDLNADDPIRIDGTIEGDIRGTLVVVSRGASVNGSILAQSIHIAGSVTGRVEAAIVTLTRHARLDGEITCETLGIETGANIRANCTTSQSSGRQERRDDSVDAVGEVPDLAVGNRDNDNDFPVLREPQAPGKVEDDEAIGSDSLDQAAASNQVDGEDRREPSLDPRFRVCDQVH